MLDHLNDLVYADKGENTEKQYYVTDPHGNVVQLMDESGAVTKTYEYDSFGNEVDPEKKDDNPFRYCGEYYDKETEEIYLRARYYQPIVGRFLTRDTYTGENDEPLSLHLYTYCGNDGVNAWDSSGHCYKNHKWTYCDNVFHQKYKGLSKGDDMKYYHNLIKQVYGIKGVSNNSAFKKFKSAYKKEQKKGRKSKYNKIAKSAKIPPLLVAAIHYREGATDCLNGTFKVTLSDGGKINSSSQFVKEGKKAMKSVQNYKVIRPNLKLKYKKNFKDIYAMSVFAWFHNGATVNKINSYIFNKCSFDTSKLDKDIDPNIQFFNSDHNLAPSGKKDDNIGVFPLLDYMLKNAGKGIKNV